MNWFHATLAKAEPWADWTNFTLGLLLLGLGAGFLLLGLLLLLDPALIALGSVQMLAGVVALISPRRYYTYVLRGARLGAQAAYVGGILLMLARHVYLGILLQVIGFACLFRPVAALLRPLLGAVPYVGPLLARVAS